MPAPTRSRRPERGSSRQTEQRPLKSIAGHVGQDPEWKQAGSADVIEFSVAVPNGYGDDAPPPTWIKCTAWDRKPELQTFIENEIYKGAAVAVEGTYSSNKVDGKTYHQINVVRIGLVDWFKAEGQSSSRSARPTREAPVEDDDLDELPF